MLLGTFTPRLDDKGRLVLPAKFRAELAAGLVITQGQEKVLSVYPREVFEAEVRKALEGPITVRSVRDYQRMLAANASEETPDSQGRITIPPPLRQYAGLERDVVVTGALNRVEIWNPAVWEQYTSEQEQAFAEMNDVIFPGTSG